MHASSVYCLNKRFNWLDNSIIKNHVCLIKKTSLVLIETNIFIVLLLHSKDQIFHSEYFKRMFFNDRTHGSY